MHPELFHLGPLTLRTYGLFMALGYLAGISLMVFLNRKEGRSDELALDWAVWIMIGAIVGGRLMYIVVQPDNFVRDPIEILRVWNGGLVYYGGLIGASLTSIWYLRRHKAPLWKVADCAAPGIAVGQALGRVGCYFNGCCYGVVSEEHGVVFPALGDNLPHLPTQLWESALALLLAGALFMLKARRAYAGQIFVFYLWFYGGLRFCIEFWRGDEQRGVIIWDIFSPAQWTSLASVAIGTWLHFYLAEKKSGQAA
jgi:phosphatidylglycerol:prolipoprotein diacylglycerol transferase